MGGLHVALPGEVEGWLVAVQGMLCSFGWGYSLETDEKQCQHSVRSWEQMNDCVSALPHHWCEVAREMPSSRAGEEHCFLPEWFLVVLCLVVRSRRSPSCPAKPESFLWATHLARLLED